MTAGWQAVCREVWIGTLIVDFKVEWTTSCIRMRSRQSDHMSRKPAIHVDTAHLSEYPLKLPQNGICSSQPDSHFTPALRSMQCNLRMPVYHLSEDILTRLIFADLSCLDLTHILIYYFSLTTYNPFRNITTILSRTKIETSSQVRKYSNKYPNKHKTLSH